MLVLLRTAIGWHFLYEGLEKLYSTPEGRSTFLARILPPPHTPPPMEKPEPAFSAEVYLRNATGPLAPYFRSVVPDVDSREKLDIRSLKATWNEELERFATYYQLTPAQREEAAKALEKQAEEAEAWFNDTENAKRVQKYFDDLRRMRAITEDKPEALESERSQALRDRAGIESDRRSLVQVVDGWTQSLRESWKKLLTPEQLSGSRPLQAPWSRLDWINAVTKYGLTAVGACLLVGLFTRLAALGAAGYLAMFYLSMPPWPGLPPGPMAEGHYLFVNKNLIEMLACLVLATTPTGYWIGLDAVLFGWLRRRRRAQSGNRFDSDPAHSSPEHRNPGTFTRSDR
jgi:uncharacterized membrane protein YphA (DoxX/SURF4 family)